MSKVVLLGELDYEKFTYLRPPRPEASIPEMLFRHKEKLGWIAQAKMNGSSTVLFVSPERELFAYDRHGERLKSWAPSEESGDPFRRIQNGGWWVFNAELLNKAPATVKDTLYLYDILVANGRTLTHTSYEWRYGLLLETFRRRAVAETRTHFVMGPKLWVARNYKANFALALSAMEEDPAVEGLVFRDPEGKLTVRDLAPGGHGCDWLAKFRRPSRRTPMF